MTRARSTTPVAALAALAMLVTACTESTNGTAETPDDNRQQDEQHSRADLPHSGAPAVDEPIDTTRFEDDPCLALDDELLAEAGYEYEEAEARITEHDDSVCDWDMGLGYGHFRVAYTLNNKEGLSGIYEDHALNEWALFNEVDETDGYPTLIADPADARDRGSCNAIVGVRDDLAMWVTVTAGPGSNAPFRGEGEACEAAYELAELAVETMKGDN
ncbi:DUF3558 domain-containing protein [Haloechinothrix sp. LS1_15]|uniref:DUF3558 domain-containing protein n=1 Tax=Haloechinothrix sp. LS1_15 TaxID=2652248 RepID=UPI0029466369|nr:DUF3558 domain-containing protein [Haloechinothrix sp. LS1_15]MDV6012563.1 DUF3558 domain-containing protein [Haloechinothrix sp. LS1_15]